MEAEQDLSGMVLNGRYRLGERLGAGGWGSVYAAVQIDLGRPVAIKVLHKNVALASDGLMRFEREAKSAAALGHPNIAQVSDFQANANEPPFLVMEMLTGATLGTILREESKLPAARVAWIAYQILAGLDVAHRAGIIHRDIKPDNVFLVAMPGVEDFVKLLDFGIAKLAGDANTHATTTGTMLGSPAFMAPEQVRSNDVDHRVDIYALGATMYLALAGQMPFNAQTIHGLLLAITEQRATALNVLDPSIDGALSALVERAMHKDPGGRFASAAEMRGALEPWLGGAAAHASATANAARLIGSAGPGAKATAAIASVAPPPTVQAHPNAMSLGPSMMGPPPAQSMFASSVNPYAPPPGAVVAAQSQYMAPAGFASSVVPAPAPSPPAKSSGAVVGLLIAVVVLLLVVVGGGIAAFVYFGSPAASTASAPATSGSASTAVLGVTPPAAGAASVAAAGAAGGAGGAGGAGAGGAGAAPARPGSGAAAKPVTAGAATPATTPAAASPAGAPGAPAAAAPVARKQFAGSSFNIGGGSFGVYEILASKAAIMRVGGSIGACYSATEFDPPDHQFTNWTFQVDPAGNVRSVGRTTNFELHPKFDACMIGALRQVKWAVTPSGGSPQVSFNSRTRDNP